MKKEKIPKINLVTLCVDINGGVVYRLDDQFITLDCVASGKEVLARHDENLFKVAEELMQLLLDKVP